MGQYYRAVNITKKEVISPYEFKNGAKLMEHSWIGNNYVGAVLELLKPGNTWHMTRIVWAGDYMNNDEFLFAMCKDGEAAPIAPIGYPYIHKDGSTKEYYHDLYSYASEYYTVIKPADKGRLSYKKFKFLCNHSLEQFVDLSKCPIDNVYTYTNEKTKKEETTNYIVNPLPILTSSGNGRGGGDYHGASPELVGIWAGDVISLETKAPAGFLEIAPNFKESTR